MVSGESSTKKARVEGESFYKVVDGVKYDRALLEKADAFAKDGQISYAEAKKLYIDAEDGKGITDIEKQTLEYSMKTYKFSEKATNFLTTLLKAGSCKSYYKVVGGVKYDRDLLEKAEISAADGQVSFPEAQQLIETAKDGKGITDIERATLEYVLKNFKFTEKAKSFFMKELNIIPSPQAPAKDKMPVAEQIYYPIAEISTYQTKWTIKGRVTSRAPLRTFKKGNNDGKVFHVELLDAEGGEIRASFFNEAATEWYEKMQVGKCFTLSRGSVRTANRQYNTCKHRYELVFDKLAQVAEVADDTKIDSLKFHIESLRDVQQKTLPYNLDICGIVTAFEQPLEFKSKEGKELVKRVITLADDSAVSMQVTLWGDRAKQEDKLFEGNPVIALKGVLVKEWQGGLSGSLLEAGALSLQPQLPEAKKVKEWWSQGGNQQSLTFISQTTGGGGNRLAASAKTLDVPSMRQASEKVSGQEVYNIYCRLSTVQTRKQGEEQPLWYTACMETKEGTNGLSCNKRLVDGICPSCNRAGKAAPRLNLRCRFMDPFDGFWVTTFHEAAQKAIGHSAEEVQEVETGKGREALESMLKASYFNEPLQVTVRAKPDNYQGEYRTNVTCIAAQPVPLGERGRSMLSEIREMIAMK